MGFLTTLGKIVDKVGDISGDIAGGLGVAGAAIAATGIGLPLAGLVEAGAVKVLGWWAAPWVIRVSCVVSYRE